MKKVTCLIALVLATSSTAWGICGVTVEADPACAEVGEAVSLVGTVCCRGQWDWGETPVVSRFGNQIYVDVYINNTSPEGCTCRSGSVELPTDLDCGLYIVVVRVWCTYSYWPYCIFGPDVFCGMGSTYFKVCCPECGCFPCCCWMNPCCPTAVVAEETP